MSAALYDASMVAMDLLWQEREEVMADKQGVKTRLGSALANEDSLALLTGQANTAQAVKDRIALMVKILSSGE